MTIEVEIRDSPDPEFNPFDCAEEILKEAISDIHRLNVQPGPYSGQFLLHDCDKNVVGDMKFDSGIKYGEGIEELTPVQKLLG